MYPHFFTATIKDWIHILKEDEYKNIITESLQFLVSEKRIKVYAFVIMPNHIHIIWQMLGENLYNNVQRDFLYFTAQRIKYKLLKTDTKILNQFESNNKDRKYQIWKYNSLSIELYSKSVLEQKLNYIHQNPIKEKWQLANNIEDYKYSSASYYVNGQSDFKFISNYFEE